MVNVLIVDDRPENLKLLRVLLTGQGYTVHTAENGEEALNKALSANPKPNLVISDVLMPVMDGFTFCQQWMANSHLCDIPFMFLTANYVDSRDAQFAYQLGAKKFLTSPLDNTLLCKEINEILEQKLEQQHCSKNNNTNYDENFYNNYKHNYLVKLEQKLQNIEEQNKALTTREIALNKTRAVLEKRIKEREKAESVLRASETKLRNIFNNAFDSIITFNDQYTVESINRTAELQFGYTLKEVTGKNIGLLVSRNHLQTLENLLDNYARSPENSSVNRLIEIECRRRDGSLFPAELALTETQVEGKTAYTSIVRDITQRKRSDAAIYHMAYHDSLTDLVNRNEFERRVTQALISANNRGLTHVLLYLDLDQFKIINDTCGHKAGDELLRQLSTLLYSKLRERDTLARLGGDEFGVLLENCPADQALQIAEMLLKEIKQFRFAHDNKTFTIGASIGLVVLDSSCQSVADVLSTADMACYTAKDLGRNRVHIYNECDTDFNQRQTTLQWVSRINQAREENRFTLYQQSIVALSGAPIQQPRFEFLLRMLDQNGKIIPNGAYIPVAERYNLMPSIDRHVIKMAFTYLHKRKLAENQQAAYFINLSAASLNDNTLYEYIKDLLSKFSLAPHNICFEITETTAITNLNKALSFIEKIKQLGCKFALDDFGTGVSSFSYLKTLPVDFLKIDGSFVSNMLNDSTDCAIVDAINQIAHVTGKQTIAEFVESEDVKQKLVSLGVDFAQGFQFDKPQPI